MKVNSQLGRYGYGQQPTTSVTQDNCKSSEVQLAKQFELFCKCVLNSQATIFFVPAGSQGLLFFKSHLSTQCLCTMVIHQMLQVLVAGTSVFCNVYLLVSPFQCQYYYAVIISILCERCPSFSVDKVKVFVVFLCLVHNLLVKPFLIVA